MMFKKLFYLPCVSWTLERINLIWCSDIRLKPISGYDHDTPTIVANIKSLLNWHKLSNYFYQGSVKVSDTHISLTITCSLLIVNIILLLSVTSIIQLLFSNIFYLDLKLFFFSMNTTCRKYWKLLRIRKIFFQIKVEDKLHLPRCSSQGVDCWKSFYTSKWCCCCSCFSSCMTNR